MRSALLRNFSFLTLSNVLLPLASTALVVAISRLGGVELLGEYSYILTFFFIGQTCTTGGMQILITRDVARNRRLAGTYFLSASVIGVLAVAVLFVLLVPWFVWAVPQPAVRVSVVIMGLALVPTVIGSFGEATLLAFERAEDFVVIGLAETFLRAATSTLLVWYGFGLEAIALSFLAFRTLAVALITIAIRLREPGASLRFDRRCFRDLARQMPVVGAIPVVNALYWRSDTLLLTWLRGLVDVGYYGASTRILDVTRSLPQAYGRAVYPLFSRVHDHDPGEFRALCRRSILWIVVAAVPLCLTTWLLSAWIVRVMYGAAMAPAAAGLAVLAWVMLPYALTSTLAQVLFATGNQLLDLKVNGIALAVNVALNLILIPRWGFVGAATASLSSMSVHVTLQYLYVRAKVCDPRVVADLGRVGLAAGAAMAVGVLVRAWNPLAGAAAALGCYGAGLWATGILRPRHARWLVSRGSSLLERTVRLRPGLARVRPPTSPAAVDRP